MGIPNDWKEFIELLNSNEVDYLIVGAHALGYHGVPRLTQDIDFFVRSTRKNGERIIKSLAEFGFQFKNLDASDFTRPDRYILLGKPPNRIDLITGVSGVDFDRAWNRRVEGSIGGVPVAFIGLDDFIANKRASGRPKDLGDIDELERFFGRKFLIDDPESEDE